MQRARHVNALSQPSYLREENDGRGTAKAHPLTQEKRWSHISCKAYKSRRNSSSQRLSLKTQKRTQRDIMLNQGVKVAGLKI